MTYEGRSPARKEGKSPRNPSGLCMCGCGKPTTVAKWGAGGSKYRKGEARRYVVGHNNFKHTPRYEPRDLGYPSPCWVWLRTKSESTGYGWGWRNGVKVGAHRLIYEERYGPISAGLQLDHLCRNSICVNPAHLEPVTAAENCRRGRLPKLTVGKVREIRAHRDRVFAEKPLSSAGTPRQNMPRGSVEALAAEYGVCKKTINNVLSGRWWVLT